MREKKPKIRLAAAILFNFGSDRRELLEFCSGAETRAAGCAVIGFAHAKQNLRPSGFSFA